MKNTGIKLVFSLIILILITSLATASFCIDPAKLTGDTSSSAATSVKTQANNIIRIVQVIATAGAVIILIWLGVKYMSAAPSERADIKKSAVIYIVGAVLLFATTGILGIIQTFAGDLAEATGTSLPSGRLIRDKQTDSDGTTRYFYDDGSIYDQYSNGTVKKVK